MCCYFLSCKCCKYEQCWISTLRYECDKTFSDECEFAAGEWCNHTCQENVFSHEYRTKFYITRGVKMRISARKACVKPHLRTRSDIKRCLQFSIPTGSGEGGEFESRIRDCKDKASLTNRKKWHRRKKVIISTFEVMFVLCGIVGIMPVCMFRKIFSIN